MHIFTDKTGIRYALVTVLALGLFTVPAEASVPNVQTYSVSSVSGSCAMLEGYSNTNNTNSYARWFEIKELNKNMEPQVVGRSYSYFSNNGGVGNFEAEAKSLVPETVYVYRTVAQNTEGIVYGQEFSFTTKSARYRKSLSGGDNFNGCSEYVPMTTNENVVVNVDTGAVIPSGANSLSSGTGNQSYTTGQYYSGTQTYSSGAGTNQNTLNQQVITMGATNIGETSARLNAKTIPTQNVAQYGRFLWGRTASFGNSTPRVPIGSGASLLLFQDIAGLLPGTTYYFKPIIDNQLGTAEGAIFHFTTAGNSRSSGSSSWVPDSGSVAYYSSPVSSGSAVKKTTDTTNTTNNQVATTQGTERSIEITDTSDITAVSPDSLMKRTFSFENVSGITFTDVEVKIILPDNETFVSENSDPFTQKGHLLSIFVADLPPGQKISLTYWTKVSPDAKDHSSLDTITIATAGSESGEKIKNFLETSVLVDASLAQTKNTAAAAFSNNSYSIFPKTLKDWFAIISLLFFFVLAYFSWKFYSQRRGDYNDGEIPVILTADIADIPKKPIFPPRTFRKDPFYSNKNEVVGELVMNTTKSAPPDNLPI